jgi:hypothetical protein
MKILLTHTQSSGGGAFLYTEEIYLQLTKMNHAVFYINGNNLKTNSIYKNISIELLKFIDFDLTVIMQGEHYIDLNTNFKSTKIINIIHSEVFEIDRPIINKKIKYIAVREEIKKYLIDAFGIDKELIKVLLNPINVKFYNSFSEIDSNLIGSKYGVFACGSLAGIRYKAAIDFSLYCHENKLKSLFIGNMSNQIKENMLIFYDEILNSTPHVNSYMRHATICGGILKGRTYWEAKLLGKPVMEYMVDSNGNIEYEIYEKSPNHEELENIKKITHPEYIVNQIIEWAFK